MKVYQLLYFMSLTACCVTVHCHKHGRFEKTSDQEVVEEDGRTLIGNRESHSEPRKRRRQHRQSGQGQVQMPPEDSLSITLPSNATVHKRTSSLKSAKSSREHTKSRSSPLAETSPGDPDTPFLCAADLMPLATEEEMFASQLYRTLHQQPNYALSPLHRILKGGGGSKGYSPGSLFDPQPPAKGGPKKSKSKGGVAPPSSCVQLKTFFYKSDVQDNRLVSDSGFRYVVDLYDAAAPTDNRVIGRWYEEITFTTKDRKSGVGSVVITANPKSSVSLAVVLKQKSLPVTGGSGLFGQCPGGFAQLVKNRIDKYYFDVLLCSTCHITPF